MWKCPWLLGRIITFLTSLLFFFFLCIGFVEVNPWGLENGKQGVRFTLQMLLYSRRFLEFQSGGFFFQGIGLLLFSFFYCGTMDNCGYKEVVVLVERSSEAGLWESSVWMVV